MDGTSLDRGSALLLESVRLPLHDLARSVARRGTRSDVDDLHQLAMEHALRLLPKYQPDRGATFLTFVFLRVRYVMKESLRAAKRDSAMAFSEHDAEPESPEERLSMEEEQALTRRRLDQALLRLDDTAIALLRACFWEDQSLAEAARRLGLSYSDARYRLKSAIAALGKVLRAGRRMEPRATSLATPASTSRQQKRPRNQMGGRPTSALTQVPSLAGISFSARTSATSNPFLLSYAH